MTSPDNYIPPNAYGVGSTASMQNVTQADVANVANGDIKNTLNQLGFSWVQNLLGGFSNVVQTIGAAINQLIRDIVYGIKGITGGLIDLTGIIRDSSNNATNSGITAGVAQNVAAVAQGTATTAQSTANTANSTANTANSTANTANTNINTTIDGITQTTDPYQVAPTMGNIVDTAQSNATAIAVIQANQNAQTTSGVSVTQTFNTASNPVTGFTQFNAGYASNIIASSGQARLFDETQGGGLRLARTATPTNTNDQSLIVVTGDNNLGLFFATTIAVRANSGMTSFVYVNAFRNKLYIGNATWSGTAGSSVSWNDWIPGGTSLSTNLGPGNTIEIQVVGNTYRVFVNSKQIIAFTDATYTTLFNDANHKYSGFGLSGGESLYLDSWSVSDLSQAETVGTGWNIYRGVSTASSSFSWSTTGAAPPASTFTVQDKMVNVLVNDLGTGKIKIVKAGWYMVTVNFRTSAAQGQQAAALLGGLTAGSLGLIQVGQAAGDGDTEDGDGTTFASPSYLIKTFSGSWVVYCPADYYLQPAGYRQTGSQSNTVIGDGAGVLTSFAGALLNPG
jgi:hypothetical protein